ncbi:suppressor of cytokine signaling 6 [Culicoides brevitarsis]|uniref:suppressor of cytokine signaling 6 n=1 Tax=Culicoides brevitarsis TaxID=469753 RepID=UPI00307BD9A2
MNESDTFSRFKWFSSLSRLKSDYNATSEQSSNKKTVNIFYTIRRKLQKRYNTTRKVKASESQHNNSVEEAARIVLESDNVAPTVASSCDRAFGIFPRDDESPEMRAIKKELAQYGWYWGNLKRTDAQKKLKGKENGSFLVRNSQTEKNQFTLSFRSAGVTLHCRINLDEDNQWSYIEESKFASPVELILETMRRSETGVFGFVKQDSKMQPPFPVRLTNPINRFYEVTSLQHLCKNQIRSRIHQTETIEQLPLPNQLKDFLQSDSYEP